MKEIYSPMRLRKYLSSVGMPPDKDMYATNNFSWSELLTKQKELPSLEVLENLLSCARVLQVYRDKLFKGAPITITSGWRSSSYNKSIGGAFKSYHIDGKAIDFVVKGYTPLQVQDMLDEVHFGGLEFAPTWTHIDIRGSNCRFNPNNTIRQPHYDVTAHNKLFHG